MRLSKNCYVAFPPCRFEKFDTCLKLTITSLKQVCISVLSQVMSSSFSFFPFELTLEEGIEWVGFNPSVSQKTKDLSSKFSVILIS